MFLPDERVVEGFEAAIEIAGISWLNHFFDVCDELGG